MSESKFAELFESVKESIAVCIVIDEYEKGLKFRFGKVVKELTTSNGVKATGFHWLIPFADEVLVENIAYTTEEMDYQSLTTKDDVSIVLASVLSYKIKNIRKFLVDVEDADSVVVDITYGLVNEYVRLNTWDQVRKLKFQQEIYEEIRGKAFKWGIEVVGFNFSNMVRSKAIRLVQD